LSGGRWSVVGVAWVGFPWVLWVIVLRSGLHPRYDNTDH
jgi:hypothetical protein